MPHTLTSVSFSHASTQESNPTQAIADIVERLRAPHATAIILFVSADYDLAELALAIRQNMSAVVLCCTTAGEIGRESGYSTGGIVAAAISGVRAELIHFDAASPPQPLIDPETLTRQSPTEDDNGEQSVGLLVVDGLCRAEEGIIRELQALLPSVPIVGGSAGDNCRFLKTHVFVDGHFISNAGALLLLTGPFRAMPFQMHHFGTSGTRVVATKVDAADRRLIELDGIPARRRLATILGKVEASLSAQQLSLSPLMLKHGQTTFVRSISAVHEDGSVSLYCAVNLGDILHIGSSRHVVDSTALYFDALSSESATPDLIIGFDCILRRAELQQTSQLTQMHAVLKNLPFVGFSTYGEQCNGLHVNQTMTGIAFWERDQ